MPRHRPGLLLTSPVISGKTHEDRPLVDPEGQDLDTVRRIVGQVEEHVLDLLARTGRA